MKTTFDISDKLYRILNVPEVTGIISGSLYIKRRPKGSIAEDIVILVPSEDDRHRE